MDLKKIMSIVKMSTKNIVIVESPAKAKTIKKYLGADYEVMASFGHVRDLPAKDGSVLPDRNFSMSWEVDGKARKRIGAIAQACKGADILFLATDPDREGEAISWHLYEELVHKKALNEVQVFRVVFHEITKNAVLGAMMAPRALDQALIDAYLARRALDYLVGFTLSPVLWRKLPGARSAGRVQSVALRLVCERESEIEIFRSQEYWSLGAVLKTLAGASFSARLTHLDGKKLRKFDLANKEAADAALEVVRAGHYHIAKIEHKTTRRTPWPPFTTSTLQQEASRKLGLSASRTMSIAQKLYEGVDLGGESVGLITYMRTDSTTLSRDALSGIRQLIVERFGEAYLPNGPRIYKTKAKNAQEAHEAIRPTDTLRHPDQVRHVLDQEQFRLYELIWKRAVASQMENAVLDQLAVDLASGQTLLRATGSVLKFDGFLTLYKEGVDDPEEDQEEGRILPAMNKGESVNLEKAAANQHFTQPPPRYTEASLVKKMEELGIGRPSTYASILRVLQDRDYVRLDQRRFIPEDRGRLVTAFLSSFFDRYFAYDFTADLEERLDDVSGGKLDWRVVLRDFWTSFSEITSQASALSGTEVRDRIDDILGAHFFPPDENGDRDAPRKCPSCPDGRLGLNFGRYGAFITCSNYPECKYTRNLSKNSEKEGGEVLEEYPKELGKCPDNGDLITIRQGPYGFYVQRGEVEGSGKNKTKPKRASLLKDMKADQITLDIALKLLSLPRILGHHPDSGEEILAGMGRYGPYLKLGPSYHRLPPDDDVLAIGLNRAVTVLAESKSAGRQNTARILGDFPEIGGAVSIGSGRFGPYVKHGRLYASIPKNKDPQIIDLEEAIDLLRAKAAKTGVVIGAKKALTKKAVAKKSKTKKARTKKSAAKKATAKKSEKTG